MRKTPVALAALVAGLALVAGGCGGSSSSGSGGGGIPESASLVPASAPLYVYANTDFSGDQWTNLNTLLAKFPDRAKATTAIQAALQKKGISWDDIKAALGPDTGIGALSLTGVSQALLLNKANDQAKLDALIAQLDKTGSSAPTQKRVIDGWTVVGSNQAALDASAAASKGTSLADSQALKDAFAALPADALAKVFVDGKSIANAIQARGGATGGSAAMLSSLSSVAASVGATQDGIEFDAVTQGALGTKTFKPSLVSEIPAGALVYAGFDNVGAQITKLTANPQIAPALGQLQTAFGVSAADLAALLAGEGALYVLPGSPLPTVSIVLESADPNASVATLDKLTAVAAKGLGTTVETTTVGGVSAKKLTVRGITVYYAAVDGKLVITNAEAGITGLSSSGDKLADDQVYKDATKAAGVPSEVTGIFYVNIKDTVPLIESFASLAGQSLPAEATTNLEHITSFVAYGTADGNTNTVKAFLQIQ